MRESTPGEKIFAAAAQRARLTMRTTAPVSQRSEERWVFIDIEGATLARAAPPAPCDLERATKLDDERVDGQRMPQVPVTIEEAAFLAERIARFEQEVSEQLRWQLPFVVQHQALPLYVAWTETAGLRADGTLVRWVTEDQWGDGRELDGVPWVNLTLVQGAKRYPELRRLIPSRPKDARTCDGCEGNGIIPNLPRRLSEVICKCGGIGWLV